MTSDTIFAALAKLGFSAAASAVVAFWLFRTFSEKWIEDRFRLRLEEQKHEQNREIEQLRGEMSALLGQLTRLRQREFELLPEIWKKANAAFGLAVRHSAPSQSYPDLSKYDGERLAEVLGETPLTAAERDEVTSMDRFSRNPRYIELVKWHRYSSARTAVSEFHNAYVEHSILLDPTIEPHLKSLSNLMWKVTDELELSLQGLGDRAELRSAWEELRADGVKLFETIKAAIAERLWTSA